MLDTALNSDYAVYKKNLEEARGYHFRAVQFAEEKMRPSVVFNVSAVAIERYLLAICANGGVMPFNHNYNSLVNAVEMAFELEDDLKSDIRSLDLHFGICSLEKTDQKDPGLADSRQALDICARLSDFCDQLDIHPEKMEKEEGSDG